MLNELYKMRVHTGKHTSTYENALSGQDVQW